MTRERAHTARISRRVARQTRTLAERELVRRANMSLGREPQCSVETNDFAVEVIVVDDAGHHRGVLGGLTHPLRERDLRSPVRLELLRRDRVRRRQEHARRDRDDADAKRREVASGDQSHADHAALGRRVGELADLALVTRNRRGVDDHAAGATVQRLGVRDGRSGQPHHVEHRDQVVLDRRLEAVQVERRAVLPDKTATACRAAVRVARQDGHRLPGRRARRRKSAADPTTPPRRAPR